MGESWLCVPLGDLVEIHDRHRVPVSKRERDERPGPTPYYGASGIIDSIDGFTHDGRFLLVAEDGENLQSRKTPIAFIAKGKFWANNHVHVLKVRRDRANDVFLCAFLENSNISGWITGAAQPKLSQANLVRIAVEAPPVHVQDRIAAVLTAYDQLIENNLRRIEVLERMAQALYREWFVDFRFPGHGDVALVESPLGAIPEGWAVRSVVDLAGGVSEVVGGPFGSKLGRNDYVKSGVPVVRGTNLNGPLGWDEREFVFVSNDKFEELRGNSAQPGDIIVTQRGTLGQVGLIPTSAPWGQLVVSQSQMRVRVDPRASSALFVYHSLRWPSTNKRLVDHAMSSGVPHINLGILRDFRLAVPPLPLAMAYDELVLPMRRLAENLSLQNANLKSTRELLLPRLMSGELDVSELDIDTEWLAS
jgi:type I restriction enzyme S subunit